MIFFFTFFLCCFGAPLLCKDPAPALAREAALLVEEQGLGRSKSPGRSPSPHRNHSTTSNTNISTSNISFNDNRHNHNNDNTSSIIIRSGSGDGSSSSLLFLRADRPRMDGRGLSNYLRSEYQEAQHESNGLPLDAQEKGSNKETNKNSNKDKDVDQTVLTQTSQSNLSAPRQISQSKLTAPKPSSQISSQELLARALVKLQASVIHTSLEITPSSSFSTATCNPPSLPPSLPRFPLIPVYDAGQQQSAS